MSDAEGDRPVAEVTYGRESWLRRWRMPLIVGGPAVLLLIAIIAVVTGGRYQSTDNAYVQIAKAPVSSSVGGRVIAVYVHENQQVHAGEPLFRLDTRDAQASAAQAVADVAQAEVQVRSLQAAYQTEQANLSGAEGTLAFATREAARQKALVAAGVASQQEADAAAHSAQQASDAVAAARQRTAQALANLNGHPDQAVDNQPAVLAARAKLDRARLNVSYGVIIAPADGVVTRVDQLQVGGYVNPSQTVFWLISGKPWIEANFKEDQLAKMKVGQHVAIKVDAAADAKLTGHVASFSPGAGSAFSALPAQNATGNWVKVTQRLPVRIDFDQPPPAMAGRAGLSASVKVDVKSPGAVERTPPTAG
ncbi:HlyD family secretion protein [Phenylobacterium aquaticum]|uniref:HlyD family secretion protein n=1 Tax=Phenylobacterium aquaticum TaxID=1763816 RepID=UPI0026ED27BA|nr:HlyD family secretion protein [Phenylobacterium aquaticum]